jgi:hypothetical protein
LLTCELFLFFVSPWIFNGFGHSEWKANKRINTVTSYINSERFISIIYHTIYQNWLMQIEVSTQNNYEVLRRYDSIALIFIFSFLMLFKNVSMFEVLKKFTEVKNLGLVCKLRHAKNKCLKFQKKIVFMRVFLENNKSN